MSAQRDSAIQFYFVMHYQKDDGSLGVGLEWRCGYPELASVLGGYMTGSKSRFTEIDLLMVVFWVAWLVLTIVLHPPAFLTWSVIGGGVVIANHFKNGMRRPNHLMLAPLLPLLVLIPSMGVGRVLVVPPTMEATLRQLDMGVAPFVQYWSRQSSVLYMFLLFVYVAEPLFCVLAAVELSVRNRNKMMAAVVLGGALVTPLSLLCPAVGPAHVGDPNAPCNCMPSMHVSWALMFWFSARRDRKWFFGVIALLTVWATLATGEHYIVDAIAAVPYTAFILFLVNQGDKFLIRRSVKRDDPEEICAVSQ